MIQFPIAVQVQVDEHFQLLNLFNSSSGQIHPVNRSSGKILQGCVRWSVHHCILSIAFFGNHNGLFHIGGIAILISSFDADGVSAICQRNVIGADHASVGALSLDLHAVHIHDDAGGIQTNRHAVLGGVCDVRNDGDGSLIDRLTIQSDRCFVGQANQTNVLDHGSMVVIYSGGVVDGDVVQIEGCIRIIVGMLKCNIIGTRIVVIRTIQTNLIHFRSAQGRDRNREVLPTGAGHKLLA